MDAVMDGNTKLAFSAMRRILRSTETQARALMTRTGLTPSQLVLLQKLDGTELTASSLAARLGVSQATMTVMIQKLEARGLIARRQCSLDRRRSWLSLSPVGQDALRGTPDGLQEKFASEFGKLQGWEQMAIVSSLIRVADMLDAEPDAAPLIDSAPSLTTLPEA